MVTTMMREGRRGGWMLTEVVVALAILGTVVLPLGFAFMGEVQLGRAYYYRAVAIGVVDGEMEVLVAGEHRQFQPGVHPYEVATDAARQLPGRFELTVETGRLILEWIPDTAGKGGRVRREVAL